MLFYKFCFAAPLFLSSIILSSLSVVTLADVALVVTSGAGVNTCNATEKLMVAEAVMERVKCYMDDPCQRRNLKGVHDERELNQQRPAFCETTCIGLNCFCYAVCPICIGCRRRRNRELFSLSNFLNSVVTSFFNDDDDDDEDKCADLSHLSDDAKCAAMKGIVSFQVFTDIIFGMSDLELGAECKEELVRHRPVFDCTTVDED